MQKIGSDCASSMAFSAQMDIHIHDSRPLPTCFASMMTSVDKHTFMQA